MITPDSSYDWRSFGEHVKTDGAVIHLNGDQAIVLFELLSEKLDSDTPERSAENAVFDAVLVQLERQLSTPFREDYADLLSTARNRLTLEE